MSLTIALILFGGLVFATIARWLWHAATVPDDAALWEAQKSAMPYDTMYVSLDGVQREPQVVHDPKDADLHCAPASQLFASPALGGECTR
jgi:aspartokinase-like uncharacterized kinase